MKDIMVIRYIQTRPQTYMTGAAYECEIEINDDLIYGQRGLALLVQLVISELLRTPGRDVVSPYTGGGLLNLRGLDPTAQNKGEAEVKTIRSIQAVEQQILSAQMGKSYPANETLKSLEATEDIFFDTTYGTWIIPIRIEAMSGDTQLLDVPLVET